MVHRLMAWLWDLGFRVSGLGLGLDVWDRGLGLDVWDSLCRF